jgi:hypothetical protein
MPILYHFTSDVFLPSIRKAGIWRGDVPTSSDGGFNAPWLTSDPEWSDQDWANDSILDKSKVRLTVDVPATDPNLHRWSTLARAEGVDPEWYNALDEAGGGGSAAWFVYRGNIPRHWVTAIDHRPEAPKAPKQDLVHGWGHGKTGVRFDTTNLLGQYTDEQGLGPPRFYTGKLDVTDRAFEFLSPRMDEDISEGEVDGITLMLARHVNTPRGDKGVSTIQEADGVVYRILTVFEPHGTLIMLADEA